MVRQMAASAFVALSLLLLVIAAAIVGDGRPALRPPEVSAAGDMDGDGVDDSIDNCVSVPNPEQTNTDAALAAAGASIPGDAVGNACDANDDDDGYSDDDELFIVPRAAPRGPGSVAVEYFGQKSNPFPFSVR